MHALSDTKLYVENQWTYDGKNGSVRADSEDSLRSDG